MRQNAPLKHQVFALIAILGLGTLVITTISLLFFTGIRRQNDESSLQALAGQTLQAVEKGYEDVQSIASSVAYNQAVQNYLTAQDPARKLEYYNGVFNLLNNSKMLNSSIVDLALVGENGNTANLNGDVDIYTTLYALPEISGTIHFLDAHELVIRDKSFSYQIAAMPVYDFQSPGSRLIGVLFLAIDPATFLGHPDATAQYATEVVLLNSTGAPLLGSGEARDVLLEDGQAGGGDGSFETVLDGTRYNAVQCEVRALDGTLYVLASQSAYQRQMNFMALVQALLIVLEFVAAAGIVFVFFNPLTRSLSRLTGLMQRIGSGRAQVDERVQLEPSALLCREVVDIAQAFNGMMDEIGSLNEDILENYKRMYTLEAANRQTEIAFLRSQINPHFLYNTLTLICGMAADGKDDEIIGVAGALSNIYRYSIKGGGIVQLRDEVAITESYVMIQTTRFEGRFTVEYDIARDALDVAMPGMLLQPLVENAIVHGLEGSLGGGRLTVGARLDESGENLLLWVWDTGLGMDGKQLAELREQLYQTTAGRGIGDLARLGLGDGKGVGLHNVNSRLYLQYGGAYGLEIDSAADGGTRVNIRIPREGRDGA